MTTTSVPAKTQQTNKSGKIATTTGYCAVFVKLGLTTGAPCFKLCQNAWEPMKPSAIACKLLVVIWYVLPDGKWIIMAIPRLSLVPSPQEVPLTESTQSRIPKKLHVTSD
jgi:hypothetical protein